MSPVLFLRLRARTLSPIHLGIARMSPILNFRRRTGFVNHGPTTLTTPRRRTVVHRVRASRILLLLSGLALVAVLLGPFVFSRRVASQNLTPDAQSDFVRRVPLVTNDLIYNPTTKLLYASVPSAAGPSGNSIVSVDPIPGIADTPVFIGSEPKKLALSNDGNSLYVSLEGTATIRKFDVPTKAPGMQFPIGQDSFHGIYLLSDMAVAPGNPDLVAVARSYRGTSPPEAGVAVYDNGVQRSMAADFRAASTS
jgi:hypothetical protein